ncbi:MAG: TRAP transporter TatT component family protein [Candidatus Methylomirabilia bacterium]
MAHANRSDQQVQRPPALSAVLALALLAAVGCSPRAYGTRLVADAVSSGRATFGSDNDPLLVREATPFALKFSESLLAAAPRHDGLLLSLAQGFTQYAAVFVWQDAVESGDSSVREAGRARALALYLRAREYGLRAFEVRHPGFRRLVAADALLAAGTASLEDVPLLYWTGAAWSLAVAASSGDPQMIADLPRCEALLRRALELEEDYDAGAIHEYFIAFEGGRSAAMGGSVERARRHFARAMELAAGRKVSPLVTLAESVAVGMQERREFLSLLDQALAVDVRELAPEYRQANLAAQRRAAWLKGRVDELFLE